MRRYVAAMALAGMFLWLWQGSYPQRIGADFERAYWQAGWRVLHNPSSLYEGYLGFVNVPIVAWLFAPFGWLSGKGLICTSQAIKLTVLAGMGCMALIAWLLVRLTQAEGWRRWLIVSLVMLNGPLINSVKEGNLTHWSLVLLILCFIKRKTLWEPVLLALAVVIKPPLALLAVGYVWHRKWKHLGVFLNVLMWVALVSVMTLGWPLHLAWKEAVCLPGPIAAFNSQSVASAVARLWVGDARLLDWTPIRCLPAAYTLLVVMASAGLLLLATRGRLTSFRLLCLAPLLSPLAWTHYYAWLLIPAASWVSRVGTLDWRVVVWSVALLMVGAPVIPMSGMCQLTGALLMFGMLVEES